MNIRNAFRLLLPGLFVVLWSTSALATEARPALQPSSLCAYSDLDQSPDSGLTRLVSVNSDEDPGNLDDPSPDALVPNYYLPIVTKATASLSLQQHSVPFSGQSVTAALRGPPLPL